MINVRKINDILSEEYKERRIVIPNDLLEALVFFVLTTKVAEKVYLSTYKNLKEKYPKFNDLRNVKELELANIIRSGGKHHQKAKYIKSAVRQIYKDFGNEGLVELEQMSNLDCEKYLTGLQGVGLKVARCLLLFSLNREVFPVDSHCFRIAKRLGMIGNKISYNKAVDVVQTKIKEQYRKDLHVNFIFHGRSICKAQNPKCDKCKIEKYCEKNIRYLKKLNK